MAENLSIFPFLPDFWLNDDPEGHAKRLADFLEVELNDVINNAGLPSDMINTPFSKLLTQFGCWEEAELIDKQVARPELGNPEKLTENLRILTLEKPLRRTKAGLIRLITVLFGADIARLKITIQNSIMELTLHFHNRDIFKRWCIEKQPAQEAFERFIDNQAPLSIRKINFLYRYYTDEIMIGQDYVGAEKIV